MKIYLSLTLFCFITLTGMEDAALTNKEIELGTARFLGLLAEVIAEQGNDTRQKMQRAIENDNLDDAKSILSCADSCKVLNDAVFVSDYGIKTTPLGFAPNKKFAKLFAQHGADVNCKNTNNETPLYNIVLNPYKMDAETAHYLLKHGADINNRNRNGNTLLHVVAYNRSYAAQWTAFLLQHGADASAHNDKKITPFDVALRTCDSSTIDAFKDAGTLFFYHTMPKIYNPYCLLQNEAELFKKITQEKPSMYKKTIIERMAKFFMILKESENCITAASSTTYGITIGKEGILFNNATRSDLATLVGKNAVGYVHQYLIQECSRLLCEIKRHRTIEGRFYNYAFFYDPVMQYTIFDQIMRLERDILLADIDSEYYKHLTTHTEFGNTLLHIATLTNSARMVTKLLVAGADCTAHNNNNKTPLDVAKDNDHQDSIDAFYRYFAYKIRVCSHSDKSYHTIKKYIKDSTQLDVNRPNKKGKTLLFDSLKNPQTIWCKRLLARGACPNTVDNKNHSCLDKALDRNLFDHTKLLQAHAAR